MPFPKSIFGIISKFWLKGGRLWLYISRQTDIATTATRIFCITLYYQILPNSKTQKVSYWM
jgi:hypothetical protein